MSNGQQSENLGKFPKIILFCFKIEKILENKICRQKKIFPLVLPNEEISLPPELSSPNCFRIQGGGPLSITKDERMKILVSNIGFYTLSSTSFYLAFCIAKKYLWRHFWVIKVWVFPCKSFKIFYFYFEFEPCIHLEGFS